MGWGCDALLVVARCVAGWPGAVLVLPALANAALPLLAVGLLWLGLVRNWPRWVGLLSLLAGLSTAWLAERPDLLISPSGKLIAFRAPDGDLWLSSNRAERLVRETWLRRNGQIRFDDLADLAGDEGWITCGERGCDYGDYGGDARLRVLLGAAPASAEDCAGVALLIVAQAAAPPCGGIAVIDRAELSAHGAHAVYLDGETIRIESAGDRIGERPWAATGVPDEAEPDLGDDGPAGAQ
jgi:competence protein ComEC